MKRFLVYQSIETKPITDFEVTRKPVRPVKSLKNSTWPYLNEIPLHFIHKIKKEAYDVIGVYVFSRKIMRFPRKKEA